jgi:hypothetical protein
MLVATVSLAVAAGGCRHTVPNTVPNTVPPAPPAEINLREADDRAIYTLILDSVVVPRAATYAARNDSVRGFRVMNLTIAVCAGPVLRMDCRWPLNSTDILGARTISRMLFEGVLPPAARAEIAADYRARNDTAHRVPDLGVSFALRPLARIDAESAAWSHGAYPGYAALMRPGFSSDGYAVIEANFLTRGFGTGWIFLLRKVGDVWVLLASVPSWVT